MHSDAVSNAQRELIRSLSKQFILEEVDAETWRLVPDSQNSINVFVRLPLEMMEQFIRYHSEREYATVGYPPGEISDQHRLRAAISSALSGLQEAANTRPVPGFALLLSPPLKDERPGRGWASKLVSKGELLQ